MAIQLLRPNTVAIFATDPTGAAGVAAKLTAFLLTQAVVVDVPGRFRFDLVKNYQTVSRYSIARNPVERAVADNIVKQPRVVTVQGSVSANPLALFGSLGAFGSLVRRDLLTVKQLRILAERGEPLVVVTPSEVHGSMGLAVLAETHDLRHKVELSLTFEEMEIVSPLAVSGALDLDAALAGAGSTSNNGAQPVDPFADPGGLA